MMPVTQRIKTIKQPYGGYLPVRGMHVETFDDGVLLGEENVHPALMGTAVDVIARAAREGSDLFKAFEISVQGARLGGYMASAAELIEFIQESGDVLSDESIRAALALVKYDSIYRGGVRYDRDPIVSFHQREASTETIANARAMVLRTQTFFAREGGVTVDGFVFVDEENLPESRAFSGYTRIVSKGDGDILTDNGLWDLKVSKRMPTSQHTLQLLMYYLMGLRSFDITGAPLYGGNFHRVEKLGVFNPRLNTAYTVGVSELDPGMLQTVETDVIGYKTPRPTV